MTTNVQTHEKLSDESKIVEIELKHIYLIVSAFVIFAGLSVFIFLLEKIYYQYTHAMRDNGVIPTREDR